MGELGALFNPGMRHELEERRSKAARREEEGNARDGDLRIDLESGVAVINVTQPADEAEQSAVAAESAERAADATLQDTLAFEDRAQAECFASPDHREAINAFVEKRTPKFTGR